jgi:FtsP/CotA-like multicopper oxidase with cupredoxin domain
METGRNSRRGVSPAIGTTTENGEALGLLSEEEEGEDEERSIDLKVRNQKPSADHSRWLRPLGIALSALLFITIAGTSSSTLYQSFRYSSNSDDSHQTFNADASHDEMLGIRLHPQDHMSRPPTTLTHHWNITAGYRSPDGVRKKVYLVNDLFPGPTIECRSGDRLVIHVTNSLDSREGVSIHWHGLGMRNAINMDGAVGFTQCAIATDKTFVYDFVVDLEQAGTFWWHAHSQVERGDGMYGGLVVHKPVDFKSEGKGPGYKDEVLFLVGDWYHRSAEEVLGWYTSVRGFGNEVRIYLFYLLREDEANFHPACPRLNVNQRMWDIRLLNGRPSSTSRMR